MEETTIEIKEFNKLAVEKQCELTFSDVNYSVKIKKKKETITKELLKGITGTVKPGTTFQFDPI